MKYAVLETNHIFLHKCFKSSIAKSELLSLIIAQGVQSVKRCFISRTWQQLCCHLSCKRWLQLIWICNPQPPRCISAQM